MTSASPRSLCERYNDALRRLADRRGLQLIDLETWGLAALKPRDEYFQDSVHLRDDGQAMLGRHMADELERGSDLQRGRFPNPGFGDRNGFD